MVADALQKQLTVSEDEEERELKGAERAAVLLLALGEDHGRPIWEKLDEIEVRQVSAAMANLGPVTPTMLEALFMDFVRKISSKGSLTGNVDATERLLNSFLPDDRVNIIMEEIRGPAGRNMWEKLSNVQENVLANYLKNEYPQTVAVVLSKINSDHAARVLGILPEELALEVVSRMLRMDAVQKEVLEKVGYKFSGLSPDGELPEIVEISDHPWFIGVQFHPELKSTVAEPHPLFAKFVKAAMDHAGVG